MKEFKGTPGPWLVHDTYEEYNDYTPENPQIIVWDGDEQASKYICDMGEMGDFNYAEELANAKLIAAAPELLNACLQLMDCYKNKGQLLSFDVDIVRQAVGKALSICQQCNTAINEDGLCPFCDNYLYDHEV